MDTRARAVADPDQGIILASIDIPAPPSRVFQALASPEIVHWWSRPEVFDTREWSGDVRPGGNWRATGFAKGQAYTLEGEFLEIDSPRKLVHTWRLVGVPIAATAVTYLLEALDQGTHVTLRHSGFTSRDVCINTALGWETSLDQLVAYLFSEQRGQA